MHALGIDFAEVWRQVAARCAQRLAGDVGAVRSSVLCVVYTRRGRATAYSSPTVGGGLPAHSAGTELAVSSRSGTNGCLALLAEGNFIPSWITPAMGDRHLRADLVTLLLTGSKSSQ
jgi:hypothetical protein